MKEKSKLLLLLILLCFVPFLLGNIATLKNDQIVPSQPTPTIEPTQVIVPGAAPHFQQDKRVAFNLITAFTNKSFYKSLFSWTGNFKVGQGSAIWISIVMVLVVAFNYKKWKSLRNLDLILMLLPGIFLVNTIELVRASGELAKGQLFGFLYLCLYLTMIALLVRALMRTVDHKPVGFIPNLPKNILIILTIFFVILNMFQTISRKPDDAGYYSNIGAYYLLNTGKFPYGSPELRGGAAATYGPVLYIVHIPFQLMLKPIVDSQDANSPIYTLLVGENGSASGVPPVMATKLALISLHLIAVFCLYWSGKKLVNPTVGWALACLYVSSSYVIGLGGDEWMITGATYISHLGAAGLTLLSFALLLRRREIWSGIVLALAAGAIYFPLFYFPAWFGFLFWRKNGWVKFLVSFMITCVIILAVVLLTTQHKPGETGLRAIYESTVGHQEAQDAYGSSNFSFWSTQPKLAAMWQKQFVSGWYLFRPSVIIFSLFLIATFFLARGRSYTQLAALTAAIAIAVQFWKSHAGGSYVEWYYPFLLIGILAYPCINRSFSSEEQPEQETIPQEQVEYTTYDVRLET